MLSVFPTVGKVNSIVELLDKIDGGFVAEKRPVFYPKEWDLIGIQEYGNAQNYSAVVRQDTKEILAIMSAKYGVSQYKDALSCLDDLVQANEVEYLSGAVIDRGARLFVNLRAPNPLVFSPDDVLEARYIVSASHDGSSTVSFYCAPYHTKTDTMLPSGVICKIKHTKNVDQKLKMLAGIANKMRNEWTHQSTNFAKFAKLTLVTWEAESYFKMLIEDNDSKQAENIQEKLLSIYTGGIPSQIPSCKGTLLGALISAMIFADYYKTTRKSTRGRSEFDIRLESLLDGTSARFKANAFEVGLRMIRAGGEIEE